MGLVYQAIGTFWQPDWLDWIPCSKALTYGVVGTDIVLPFITSPPGGLSGMSELRYARDREVGGFRLAGMSDSKGYRGWTREEVDAQSTDRVIEAGAPVLQCEKSSTTDTWNLYARHLPGGHPTKHVSSHWLATLEGYWNTTLDVYDWMDRHPATRSGVIVGWKEPPRE